MSMFTCGSVSFDIASLLSREELSNLKIILLCPIFFPPLAIIIFQNEFLKLILTRKVSDLLLEKLFCAFIREHYQQGLSQSDSTEALLIRSDHKTSKKITSRLLFLP